MRRIGVILLVLAFVATSQATITGSFNFNGGTATDSSDTAATTTVGAGATLVNDAATFVNGPTSYITAVASNWDGVYWSSASSFQATWSLDMTTTQTTTAANGIGIMQFQDTALAGTTNSHGASNKILGMNAAGKLFVAAAGIQNDALGNGTTAYEGQKTVNDGQTHSVEVFWNISEGGTLVSGPLQNDVVTIYVDGVEDLVLTGFDFNFEGADVGRAAWSTPGMIIGSDYRATKWDGFTGTLDNVEFSNVPEPCTMAMLGLGGLALLRKRNRK